MGKNGTERNMMEKEMQYMKQKTVAIQDKKKKINQKKKKKIFMKMVKLNLMEHILEMKNGQEKDMILMVIWNMK